LVPESALSKDAAANGAAATDAPPDSEEIVGIALGSYNPDSTEAYFKAQKLPTSKSHGYTLFAFGSGVGPNDLFFFFVDSNKAAFGHRQLLEKLIAVRYGEEDSLLRNDKMYNLINEVNGSGVVWAVLDPAYTKLAMGQLAPEVQQFPAGNDHYGDVEQRHGREVSGGLRIDGRCEYAEPVDGGGAAL
jgi:hypothetical protein